ncbi:MAG TPA: putative sulfate exporter family transporter [Pseudomonadales bacterium]
MPKFNFTEDILAIVIGAGLLLIAAIAWIVLPYGTASAELAAAASEAGFDPVTWRPQAGGMLTNLLQGLVVDLGRWNLNPLDALSYAALLAFALLTLVLGLVFATGASDGIARFLGGFVLLSLVALLAYLLGNQNEFRGMGFGYPLWAIALGLLVSNGFGLPDAFRPALQHELYVKTGLVLLGAEVLFGKVLAIGLPGIFVAWVTTPIVLVTTFWFGQRVLKIESKTLNMTVSADMSVCGTSAAIATAAACGAKKEELTTAIGLSMVFTAIMMVALPAFIRAIGMPEVLGGAWIGGTIDATGAVVAAGAFLGPTAMNVAATIKMIQNILIGVIAFGVAVYWSTKVEGGGSRTVGAAEIWRRFPKFVLGFIGASIVFSLIDSSLPEPLSAGLLEDGVLPWTIEIRDWLFCLAFASIGLSTNFRELRAQFSGGKPLILYVCGQSLNLVLTLLMAWLMFYVVFPEVTNALEAG